MSDDERERLKRSWKEIDAMRDRSFGRPAPLPKGHGTLKGGQAKRYRAQLDRIFAGGGLPEEVMRQAPGLEKIEKTDRQKRIDALLAATTPTEIGQAVDELLAHDPMPEDTELLVKILAHPKGKHAEAALETLIEVLDRGRPTNAGLLKSRIQTLKVMFDEPEIERLADIALALL